MNHVGSNEELAYSLPHPQWEILPLRIDASVTFVHSDKSMSHHGFISMKEEDNATSHSKLLDSLTIISLIDPY